MSEADEGYQSLDCGGIRFTREGLVEFDEDGIFASVDRDEVARLVLRSGPCSEHPAARVAVGVAVILLGIVPLFDFTSTGPDDLVGAAIWIAVVSFVALGIIVAALRPCFYFDVACPRGTIRFVFRGIRTLREIIAFAKAVELRFGYEIELAVPTQGFPVEPISANRGNDMSGRAVLR